MISQSCIDKYSYEREHRENDDETEKLGIMSSQSYIEKIMMKEIRERMMMRHIKLLLKMIKKH